MLLISYYQIWKKRSLLLCHLAVPEYWVRFDATKMPLLHTHTTRSQRFVSQHSPTEKTYLDHQTPLLENDRNYEHGAKFRHLCVPTPAPDLAIPISHTTLPRHFPLPERPSQDTKPDAHNGAKHSLAMSPVFHQPSDAFRPQSGATFTGQDNFDTAVRT